MRFSRLSSCGVEYVSSPHSFSPPLHHPAVSFASAGLLPGTRHLTLITFPSRPRLYSACWNEHFAPKADDDPRPAKDGPLLHSIPYQWRAPARLARTARWSVPSGARTIIYPSSRQAWAKQPWRPGVASHRRPRQPQPVPPMRRPPRGIHRGQAPHSHASPLAESRSRTTSAVQSPKLPRIRTHLAGQNRENRPRTSSRLKMGKQQRRWSRGTVIG